ncbi:EutP/PduV family microcompartment system protein [Enterococcus larvae]|uniref:EutP/PduV family microcompartment system protein n=1 Tax=Enterococcus larvae TaxID=2794352 RepID=UPI003F3D4E9F
MIIGARNSGKSSAANWLNGVEEPLKKRQDAIYGKYTIDVPAQYLENASMYRYILTLAQTAVCVLFLESNQVRETIYPPNFAASFNCSVKGIITEVTGTKPSDSAVSSLLAAGVKTPIGMNSFASKEAAVLREELLQLLS